jgi:hypothetical protein
MEWTMPTLTIGTRRFTTDDSLVVVEAERMFRLNPDQRRRRLEAAKTQLARAAGEDLAAAGAIIRRTAATILSQGIREI